MKAFIWSLPALAAALTPAAAAVVVTSTPFYRSIQDSPYSGEISAGRGFFVNFENEDDEDFPYAKLTNVDLVSVSAGNVPAFGFSVDADDGLLDNIDHYGIGVTKLPQSPADPTIPIVMNFFPNDLGQLPRWFGFVYTSGSSDQVQLDILGVGNTLIASLDIDPYLDETSTRYLSSNPIRDDTLISFVSDQVVTGFRMWHATFIADHYQWGYVIPEPAPALSLLAALALAVRRRTARFP